MVLKLWRVNIYNLEGALVCYNNVPSKYEGYQWIERHPLSKRKYIVMKVEYQ